MQRLVTASHIPLFDRLAGSVAASPDGRLLEAGGLQQSLQLDLSRLFNVRNSLTIDQFLASEGTVLHYGLPDLLRLSAQSDVDLTVLEQVIRRGIALYEPRLTQVQVKATQDARHPTRARVAIAAAVMLGRQLCRVDFALALDGQSAEVAGVAA
jgi:type VI secretion system protein ImpF